MGWPSLTLSRRDIQQNDNLRFDKTDDMGYPDGPRRIEYAVGKTSYKKKDVNINIDTSDDKTNSNKIVTPSGIITSKSDIHKQKAMVLKRVRGLHELCVIPDRLLHRLQSGPEGAMVVQFSHSGHVLAVASKSNIPNVNLVSYSNTNTIPGEIYSLRLFDTDDGSEMWSTTIAHYSVIYSIAWSKDDSYLLTCSSDGTSKVWDMASVIFYKYSHIFGGFLGERLVVPRIITGSSDGKLRVWDSGNFAGFVYISNKDKISPHQARIQAIVIDERSRYLISGDAVGEIYIWRTDNRGWYELLRKFRKDSSNITSSTLSNKQINILELSKSSSSGIMSLTMHPDKSKSQLLVLQHNPSSLKNVFQRVGFSADGRYVVSCNALSVKGIDHPLYYLVIHDVITGNVIPNKLSESFGVFRENEIDDVKVLVNNFTAPALALALRERENTLQLAAMLAESGKYKELNDVLHPFLKSSVKKRRNKRHEFDTSKDFTRKELVILQRYLHRMPRHVAPGVEKRASVVIPLCNVSGVASILFERRSGKVRTYKNQVCFPGGMLDEGVDATIIQTSLRELEEELGIPQEKTEVLGILRCNWNEVASMTGIAVTPVVGFIGEYTELSLTPNKDEVESLFTVKLSDLLDDKKWIIREYSAPVFTGGPHIGEFSQYTEITATLPYDFNFDLFNANKTLNVSSGDVSIPSGIDISTNGININGPTGIYGSEGHYGLVLVGSANIENCNVSSTCCDNYNATIGLSSCSSGYKSVCAVFAEASLPFDYVINDITRFEIPSNIPFNLSNGLTKLQPINIITLEELYSYKGALLPTISCGPSLRLTPSEARMSGSAWYKRKVNVLEGFDTTITYQISNPSQRCDNLDDVNTYCRSRGADGWAFVIQNVSPLALGLAGSGLGYSGIDNALAVEIDTYHNYDLFDFYENHISVMTQGFRYNITSNHSRSLATSTKVPDLTDGIHTVRIKYDPVFDETAVPHPSFQSNGYTSSFVENADFPYGGEGDWGTGFDATLILDNGRSYVGLTAATGDNHWQTHDIISWKFNSLYRDISYTAPTKVNGIGDYRCVNDTVCVHRVDYDHYMRTDNIWGPGYDSTEGWQSGNEGFCQFC
eukprot:gene17824-23435_t